MRASKIRVAAVGSVLLFCSLYASTAFAQNVQFTQGGVGSGLDNTIQIPLQTYPGRGGASLPVNISYSSRVWRIGYLNSVLENVSGSQVKRSVAEAIYAEYSTSGWTSSLDVPKIEWPKANDVYWYTGKPYHDIVYPYTFRVALVYIHMPDGSAHELRKSDQPFSASSPIDMVGTFYAVDGSRMRYDSTGESTGTLYLSDGARYIFEAGCVKYIDRSGNTLNYDTSVRQWTDTLGRVIGLPLPSSPSAGDQTYTLPGIDNTPMIYTFRWRNLSDVLLPDGQGQVPALKNMSSHYLPAAYQMPTNQGAGNFPQVAQGDSLFFSDQPDGDNASTYTYVVGRGQAAGQTFNPVVLAEVILPNGLSYKFSYSIYGEITKVTYPTGAHEVYEIGGVASLGNLDVPYTEASRGVTQRKLSASGTGTDYAVWDSASTGALITTTAPDGTMTDVYRFYSLGGASGFAPFGFEDARNGMAYDERVYAPGQVRGEKGAMLRRKLTEFEMTSNSVPPREGVNQSGNNIVSAYRNARPTKDVSIILDTGGNALAKTVGYSYDTTYQMSTGLDLIASTETYFADVDQTTAQTGAISLIPAGALARSTETGYINGSSYRERNILGLSTSSIIKDSSSNVVFKSETVYDEFDSYPLLTYGDLGTIGYTDPGTNARGLATTVRRYVDVGANLRLETHAQFDQCGNLRVATNERGIQALFDYSSAYKHAYLTQATTAAPDPSGQHGSNTGFTSSTIYDYTTGAALSAVDANNQITSFIYRDQQNNLDPLNRVRKVIRPDGGWTRYEFNDIIGNLYASMETKQDDTHTVKTYQYFDALGRASRAFLSEGGGNYIASDAKYDRMGRTCGSSNPYRTQSLNGIVASAGDCSAAANWTTTTYDALGRIQQVTLPDGTTAQTSYQGVYTTMIDQAGKQRRQKVDALGRVVRVDEPDLNGSLGSVDAPAQASVYDYDALGDLVHIQQGAGSFVQHRYFKYDALSRLTYERQAEQSAIFTAADALTGNSQWSRRIIYDENGYQGLVTGQYDARNIHTSFAYDNLNRITGISYSDTVTPAVSYFYDAVRFTNSQDARTIYNLGRLSEVQTSSLGNLPATSQSYNYDLMGRVANNRQSVGTNSYSLIYSYNAGGALVGETYPSGRVVGYGYDDAARLASLSSGATTYAGQFIYGQQGLLTSFTLGNGATESYSYNSRLQLSSVSLVKNNATLERYDYKYGLVNTDGTVDETKNNGQIGRIESSIGTDKQWQQRFNYDSLGRLSAASEYRGDNNQLSYLINFDYDSFGNRYQKQSTNSNSLAFIPVEDSHINKANNRFSITGISYDDAGNILSDSRFTNHQYLYDANNRQRQVAQLDGTGAVTSVYDGAGNRVATQTNGAVDNVLVYDTGGKLVAEYGQAAVNRGTSYLMTDHQGSTRAVMDSNGAVTSRHDYQPYGAEIGAGVGERTTSQGYGQSDSARQRYAGMETDEASGMSHTLWRKYDSSSGRWTSPDPYSGSMTISDPQSFNRFSYVNNDPINSIDPTGLMLSDIGVYQTDNPALSRYEEKNATWHTLRSASGLNSTQRYKSKWLNNAITQAVEKRSPSFMNAQGSQGQIRDLGPIMNKIRWFDSGNGYPAEMPEYRARIFNRIFFMVGSKECADAFRQAGLPTPEEIINRGLTIAARPVLSDPSNNGALGISEKVRQEFDSRSSAPALTIMPQYTSKGAIIFFRAEAFTDNAYLDEAVAHEFVHAAGVGQFPLFGYSLGRGTDLSGYPHYQNIINACGYQNVIK